MAVITRDRALEIIHKTYEAINEALKTKQAEHDIWLKDLSNRMEKINKLRSQKEYEDVLESLDTEGLQEYFNLVGKMAKALQLPIYRKFEDKRIAEINTQEIRYFLKRYRDSSNWEYDGHGSFIAKKSATLWELGGMYWDTLFELPENPDMIHIGDKIKLKEDILNAIYDYFTKDINGNYSFEAVSPELKDVILEIIGMVLGAVDKWLQLRLPQLLPPVRVVNKINDICNVVCEVFTEEETASKLSFFIQQYSTEGQEEDGLKKFVSVVGLAGSIFSVLSFLSAISTEQNRYQIVKYGQRKAFINSARDEMRRIQQLQESVREEELQTEIAYFRFLEKQKRLLKHEIDLNNKRERQQLAEILYNYSHYNTHGATYKDRRSEKSPPSYHTIDYRKLFEEENR